MGEKFCQFCTFAGPVAGLPEGILVCDYSGGGEKSYTATTPSEACDNFRPSDNPRPPASPDAGTRLIPVKGAAFAVVDAGDYEALSKYRWYAKHTPTTCYAVARHKGKQVYMHRVIMDAPKGLVVDHIDRNGLNNRRKNLRVCTVEQNNYNYGPRKGCTSRYKGVAWNSEKRKFRAAITCEQKNYHLGYFADEKEAARAYDRKAAELFGEFAYLNFPEEHDTAVEPEDRRVRCGECTCPHTAGKMILFVVRVRTNLDLWTQKR